MLRWAGSKWEVSAVTLIGDRDNNQDFLASTEHKGVLVAIVADGLGGHAFGEWASRFFCEAVMTHAPVAIEQLVLGASAGAADKAVLEHWFESASSDMRTQIRQRDAASRPHTTAAMVVLLGDRTLLAHVGDSRVYRLYPDQRPWRTRDHSLVQMLLDEGDITEQAMGTHPDQGALFKAVGMDKAVSPTVKVQPALAKHEALLLCSDGLWEHISPTELAALRSAGHGLQALRHAAERACQRAQGGSDNVTAMLIRPQAWRRCVRKLVRIRGV